MSKKKNKKKQEFKRWEKWFVGFSSLMVVITILVYSSRLIYYYKLEHPSERDNSLRTHIIDKGVVYSGDGLYSFDQSEYYYVGMNVDNYLWYSGRLWRIISINDQGIRMITDNSQSSLVWAINSDYDNSYIKRWLGEEGEFLKSLGNYQEYLVNDNFCVDKIDVENITCNEKINSNIGLLSVDEYLRSNGKDGYLNNGEYFWLLNTSVGNRAYYVFSEGGINNETSVNDTYYSYGVRPVVVLGKHVDYYGGDGTIDSPYQVNMNSDDVISSKSVGEYVLMDGIRFRIQKIEQDSVKLIMDDLVTSDSGLVKKSLKKTVSYLKSDLYNGLTKDNLVKCDFNIGKYGKDSEYNYQNIFNKKVNDYLGLPSIGELFVGSFDDYWLYNEYNNEMQYKGRIDSRIIADSVDSKNYIRAVVCVRGDLKIKEGTGYFDSPYVVMK